MEIWKPIPGFDGYDASSEGRIRSVGKIKNNGLSKVLKQCVSSHGYRIISIYGNGKRRQGKVHQLVMMAFHGEPQGDKREVNHKDGNKENNNVENLEYVTQQENQAHAITTGLCVNPRGDGARYVVYSFSQLQEMRLMRIGGSRLIDICNRFGVSKSYASTVVRGIHRANG